MIKETPTPRTASVHTGTVATWRRARRKRDVASPERFAVQAGLAGEGQDEAFAVAQVRDEAPSRKPRTVHDPGRVLLHVALGVAPGGG